MCGGNCSRVSVPTLSEDVDKQDVTTITALDPRAEVKAGACAAGCEGASSSPTASLSSSRIVARWTLIAACLLAALVGRLSYLAQPFDDDAAMFIYLGRVVCEGGRFCHDVIDNKFPTVGLITSLAYRAFGAWWPGYVIAQTAMGVGGAWLLARTAARQFGEAARLPALLFALVYFNLYIAVYGGFQLETMQCFFVILAAGAAMEALRGKACSRDAFVVGLAAGCAAMLKPTGVAVLVAFAVAGIVAWRRTPWKLIRHGGAARFGLAIPAVVTLVYLVVTDVWRDMPALYRQISSYAAATPFEWIDVLKPLTVVVIVGFPMLVRGWIGRRDRIETGDTSRPIVIFLIAWLVFEFIGVLAQRRMYAYHFLPLAPPAALLFAAIPRRERLAHLAAALLPAAAASIVFGGVLISTADEKRDMTAAAEYLLDHARPGERVWQDWMARTLIETGLEPGSRVPLTFLFMNHDAAPQEFSRMILDDFARLEPEYVVLHTDLEARIADLCLRSPELAASPVRAENYRRAYRAIEAYVKVNYAPEADVGRQTVYRRRPQAPALAEASDPLTD
jgi:hypothetical protein